VSAEYDSALLVKRHTISIDTRIVMLYNNFAIIVKTKKKQFYAFIIIIISIDIFNVA